MLLGLPRRSHVSLRQAMCCSCCSPRKACHRTQRDESRLPDATTPNRAPSTHEMPGHYDKRLMGFKTHTVMQLAGIQRSLSVRHRCHPACLTVTIRIAAMRYVSGICPVPPHFQHDHGSGGVLPLPRQNGHSFVPSSLDERVPGGMIRLSGEDGVTRRSTREMVGIGGQPLFRASQ